jgi:hypothetical protein
MSTPPYPYYPPGPIPPPAPHKSGLGTAGLVLGILSLVFCVVPAAWLVLPPILAVLAIVFGAVGNRKSAWILGILGLIGYVVAWGITLAAISDAIYSVQP